MRRRFRAAGALVALCGFSPGAPPQADDLLGGPSRFARFNAEGGGDENGAGGNNGGGGAQAQNNAAPNAADLQRQLNDLTGKLKNAETERDGFKKKSDEYESKTLSETDRLARERDDAKARADAAEGRAKETSLRASVEREARKLDIVDEDAAYKLIDVSAVTFDRGGKPQNVAELLKALVKAKPYLVRAASGGNAGGGITNAARGGGGGNGTGVTPGLGRLRAGYAANSRTH